MALSKYYGKSNSFGTGYVDSLFRKQYSFTPRRVDDETVERIYNSLENRKRMMQALPEKRSFLDRTFDALLVGNYAVAGAFDGMVRDDKSVLEGIVGGFKAANPFGKGYKEGETSFSDVFRSAGWESENEGFFTKATRGTAGFALDVLLDPTTYLTFGTSALAKGTGKVGTAIKTIDDLAKNSPEFAEGLKKAGSMTDEMSLSIVERMNIGKEMSSAQLASEARELKSQYNKLIGVDRNPVGITFGVQNMPFGDKVAKKLGITRDPVTLVRGSTLQKISDTTGMARSYQMMRNGIYGSKIGKYLSNNAGLKSLAEKDPNQLYEYIGAVNSINGRNLDKMARDKEIREIGTKILNLNPSEHKKIIEALETPSLWSKVSDQLKFSKTQKASEIRKLYEEQAGKINVEISDLRSLRDDYINASESELKDYHRQIKMLSKQKDLSVKQVEVLDEIESEISQLLSKTKGIDERNVKIEQLTKEHNEALGNYTRMYEMEGEEVAVSRFNKMDSESIITHFDELSQSVKKSNAEIKSAKDLPTRQALVGQQRLLQNDLRESVSEYLFGRSDYITRDANPSAIEELTNLIKSGQGDSVAFESAVRKSKILDQTTKETLIDSATASGWQTALREFIESNPNFVNNSSRKIYSHLANKYGYKAFSDIVDRYDEIREVLRRDKSKRKPNSSEMVELARLDTLIKNRNAELLKLKNLSPKELEAFFEEQKLAQLRDEIDYLLHGDIDEAIKHKEAINKYSEGQRGKDRENIGYYGKMQEAEQIGMSVEQAQYERFKALTRKKPYTVDELMQDSDSLKETLLRDRQRRLFGQSVTPETLDTVTKLRKSRALFEKYSTEYAELYKKLQENPSKRMENIVQRVGEKMNIAKKQFEEQKAHLKNNTNYNQAVRQSKNLSDGEIEFIEKQTEGILNLTNKVFPHHRYQDLTPGQRNFIQTTSYYMIRDFRKAGGNLNEPGAIQRLVDETYELNILPRQKKKATEQLEKQKVELISDTLDIGTGVKLDVDGEIVSATIIGKKEIKDTKTRESVDVKYKDGGEGAIVPVKMKKGEIDPNTGRPLRKDREVLVYQKPKAIREEIVTKHTYEEGTGIFEFEARLANGETIKVDPSKVKGTYVEDMHYETTVLPAFSQKQLDEAKEYADSIRRRISGLKGANTREKKKLGEAEKLLNELVHRKTEESFKLAELNGIERQIEEAINTLKSNVDSLAVKSDTVNSQIDDLIVKRDAILNQLDDDDAFELMVKRDLGDKEFAKLVDDTNFAESNRIGLDDSSDYDEVVKFYAKELRKHFNRAGVNEVSIGKLKYEQFTEMMERYFPRVLTEDAERYFKENPTQAEKYGKVTSKYGFGQEWSQFSKTRKLDEKSTIKANDFFQAEIGMRIFEENVGTAYINRMLKSSNLMYDNESMKDLLYRFGHTIEAGNEVKPGYTAVANYGQLREEIQLRVRELSRAEIKEIQSRKGELPESEIKSLIDEVYEKNTVQLVDSLKLDRALIAGETTPFVRLTKEQLDAFSQNKMSRIPRQINDITVKKINQQKQLIMERDERAMLKMYDKFMTFIKMNQTTIMPSFWVQTKLGNMFQGWMGVGRDVFDLKMNKTALNAVRNIDDIVKLRELGAIEPTDLINGKVYYWDEVVDLARTYGVINTDYMTKDFAAHSFSEGTKFIPGKFDPFNTTEFLPYKFGGKVASTIDNSDRLLQFASLLRQGKTPTEASNTIIKHLFDYGDLTDFEKRVMKRIFPYYTWMRKNTPLVMRQIIEQPEKMALMAKIHSSANSASGEDEVDRRFVTGFAQDWIQMPFNVTNKDGSTEPVLFNPKMPYMDLRNLPSGQGMGEIARDYFNQSTPLLKVPIELATNWNSFFDAPIANENGAQITPRLVHVMSQLSAFNAVNNFVKSEGDDKVLSLVNTFLGQKMTSYNVEANKERVYEEAYKEQYQRGIMEIIGQGIARTGVALDEKMRSTLSDIAVGLAYFPPETAVEYKGALSPITPERFSELSKEEQQKYTLDEKQRVYLNNRAMELEKEAYGEASGFKRFLWTLVEGEYSGGQTVARINKVVDGDTFMINTGDKDTSVRLLLIDTPESAGSYEENPMAYGVEASEYSKSLLLGKDVRLYIDGKDKYGRITAFVEVDGIDVGEQLLEEGLARTRYEDMSKGNYTERLDSYYNKEAEANRGNKGVWSQGLLNPHTNR